MNTSTELTNLNTTSHHFNKLKSFRIHSQTIPITNPKNNPLPKAPFESFQSHFGNSSPNVNGTHTYSNVSHYTRYPSSCGQFAGRGGLKKGSGRGKKSVEGGLTKGVQRAPNNSISWRDKACDRDRAINRPNRMFQRVTRRSRPEIRIVSRIHDSLADTRTFARKPWHRFES